MRRTLMIAAISCSFVLSGALVLTAGPLDRTNVPPRANPTVKSMIRIPGVVGMSRQSAMAFIQRAGLNVSVKESKKKPEGFEGKVVSQDPASGGIAMFGTTVTIYVYDSPYAKPESSDTVSRPPKKPAGAGSIPTHTTPSAGSTGIQGLEQHPSTGNAVVPAEETHFKGKQYYYPPQGAAAQDKTPLAPPSGWGKSTGTVQPDAGVIKDPKLTEPRKVQPPLPKINPAESAAPVR